MNLRKGKKEPRNEGPFVKSLDRTLASADRPTTVGHLWVTTFIQHLR